MQNEKIHFINYTKEEKKGIKSLIVIFAIINIIVIANLFVILSDYYSIYLKINSGKYNKAIGTVTEASCFSNTSSSMKIEYSYMNKEITSKVSSSKFYKVGSEVELLISKSNGNDISLISYKKMTVTINWILIIVVLMDLAFIMYITSRKCKADEIVRKSLDYNEYRDINSKFVRDNSIYTENYINNHTDNSFRKYFKRINKVTSKYNYKIITFLIVIITVVMILKSLATICLNYKVANSSEWDIVPAKVYEQESKENSERLRDNNNPSTFYINYYGKSQKIVLNTKKKYRAGQIINLAIHNKDISTAREAKQEIDIIPFIILMILLIIILKK